MKVEGEAHLDTAVQTDAGAKVNAKGEAHFVLLQDEEPAAVFQDIRSGRLMAIPKKRRR